MTTATATRTQSAFDSPLYGDKPRRKIEGTDFVAVRMERSTDGTVARYALFTADGMAWLGTAHFQPRTRYRYRGYSLVPFPRLTDERWPSLAAFAVEMAKRLDLEA